MPPAQDGWGHWPLGEPLASHGYLMRSGDPELRFTNTGIAVANLRVAVIQRIQQDGQLPVEAGDEPVTLGQLDDPRVVNAELPGQPVAGRRQALRSRPAAAQLARVPPGPALDLDPDRQEEAADDLLAAGRW